MLNLVSVDSPAYASLMNQLIHHVNKARGFQTFTSDGLFTVPEGIHSIRVTITGGGGPGVPNQTWQGSLGYLDGWDSPTATVYIPNIAPQTQISVVVGAGGISQDYNQNAKGGDSSFGNFISVTGARAANNSAGAGAATVMAGLNWFYCAPIIHTPGRESKYYGMGGESVGFGGGTDSPRRTGSSGIVIVEW